MSMTYDSVASPKDSFWRANTNEDMRTCLPTGKIAPACRQADMPYKKLHMK